MIDGRTKTIAILAYCSLIGYGIAWIMHSQNRSIFGAFHLKQATGIMAATISLPIVTGTFGRWEIMAFTTIPAFVLAITALTIIGIINASSDKFSELPIVGKLFSKWFSFID